MMEVTILNKEKIVLFVSKNADYNKAESIAKKLDINMVFEESENMSLYLRFDENGLALVSKDMKLYGDFSKMCKRLKTNNLRNELLVKAAKIKEKNKNLNAIDATAGLGEDSFLLAAAGFNVKLYEKNPIIAALLIDALDRAKNMPDLAKIINKMEVIEEDSINALKNINEKVDVILLDPMFPERTKSGLVKKKFQILHKIETPCNNEVDLINAAFDANPHKIIIKRPLKGEYLAGMKPSYSIKGKAIRYDVWNKGRLEYRTALYFISIKLYR